MQFDQDRLEGILKPLEKLVFVAYCPPKSKLKTLREARNFLFKKASGDEAKLPPKVHLNSRLVGRITNVKSGSNRTLPFKITYPLLSMDG